MNFLPEVSKNERWSHGKKSETRGSKASMNDGQNEQEVVKNTSRRVAGRIVCWLIKRRSWDF